MELKVLIIVSFLSSRFDFLLKICIHNLTDYILLLRVAFSYSCLTFTIHEVKLLGILKVPRRGVHNFLSERRKSCNHSVGFFLTANRGELL